MGALKAAFSLSMALGLALLGTPVLAEDPQFRWDQGLGGISEESLGGVAVDSDGNTICIGEFYDQIDLGGGPRISNGGRDIFVAKFAADGSHVWAKEMGGAGSKNVDRIALDSSEDILIVGSFFTEIDFGEGPLLSNGASDISVAKLSGTNGSHVWSDNYGGTSSAVSRSIAVDSFGNIVCVGEFLGTVNFGGYSMMSMGMYPALFVAKFDPSGNHLWSNDYGTTGVEPPTDVAVDSQDQIHVSGYKYLGVGLDFGGGPMDDFGNSDVFIVQFDSDGTHLWSRSYGDASMQTGDALAIGPSDEVVLAGTYMGSPDFGGGPLTNHGDFDFFVVCLGEPLGPTSVPTAAGRFFLGQNAPNPFNPSTRIHYYLAHPAPVLLRVYDVSGSLVRELRWGQIEGRGVHQVSWDGKDHTGRQVSSGVYVYRLDAGTFSETRRMVLVR